MELNSVSQTKAKSTSIPYSIPQTPHQASNYKFLFLIPPQASSQTLNPTCTPHHNARTPPPPHARNSLQRRPSNPNFLLNPQHTLTVPFLLLLPHSPHYYHRKPHPRHHKRHIQKPHLPKRGHGSIRILHNHRHPILRKGRPWHRAHPARLFRKGALLAEMRRFGKHHVHLAAPLHGRLPSNKSAEQASFAILSSGHGLAGCLGPVRYELLYDHEGLVW